jgi:two-component system KDP operon response regulator KdpE
MIGRHHRAALRHPPVLSKMAEAGGRVLVAGGDELQRSQLRMALECEGYHVTETEKTDQAITKARSREHDVLIVDSGMTESGPCELCRAIRSKSDVGIIVLAGNVPSQARIDALNSGADDFIPAPFLLAELMARVRAIMRRVTRSVGDFQIFLEDREVDLKSHKIKGPGDRVSHLTPKEFLVLQYLITHANHARTPQNLAQSIWQRDGKGEVEYVRIIIRQLRRKIEVNPDRPRYILTERSAGYRFDFPS